MPDVMCVFIVVRKWSIREEAELCVASIRVGWVMVVYRSFSVKNL